MRYIQELREGSAVKDVYLCKQKNAATTKNGKEYYNVILQDKTGCVDAKVWEPNSFGIADFNAHDYVFINGDVTSFNGALQVNIKQARVAEEGDYDPKDYFPVSSKNVDEMFAELLGIIGTIKNPSLKELLDAFFVKDEAFVKAFKQSTAAKTVHHGFIGGLLEHTLSVTKLCDYYCKTYPVLKRDLLLTAAICHDIGKVREISLFPENDYTDEGNLLGHIVMGTEMVTDKMREIPNFPKTLGNELKHCIVAHHGKLEFGSPKTPALMEAVALNYADDTDAKLEMFTELVNRTDTYEWQGYNRLLESNVRLTHGE
ncbi:MAG: HD domain-containing protein [Lachnospiraceae bacterium]|nr:HD domain-containing protein [Lachnospiraceae bacterium]